MTERASVVAARQLAEEARARRAGVERATSVVTGAREPRLRHSRRARAVLLAAVAAATAGPTEARIAVPAL